MTWLFWLSALLLAYAFAGYPLLLEAACRFVRRRGGVSAPVLAPVSAPESEGTPPPKVAVLLAVHNEEAVIERKIRNFLQLEYPEDRLDLYVVADACTDATEALTGQCGSPRVHLLRQAERGGKTRALNLAAAAAHADILVFTDANAMFRPDCVRRLVERLAEPGVGLASGVSMYVDAAGGPSAGGAYRRYEEWIKARESELFSIVGADGAAYAMRRGLYAPLDPECINDLLHPIQVLLAGQRAVTEPRAVVEEEADDADPSVEMRRQTRIMAQSWLICLRQLPVLARARRWGFAWQLLSHKVLRWATLPLLAVCGASAVFLSFRGGAYAVAALAVVAGGLVALAGAAGRGGLARTAWLFVVLHLAAVNGLVRLLRGQVFVTWTPRGS